MIRVAIAIAATIGLLLVLNHYLASREPILPPAVPRPVKTMIVTPVSGEFVLKYPGSTRAIQQVDIAFQVNGSLVDLPINSGDIIKKDQVIARLDPRDYQNTLDARQADYLNAKSNLEREQKLYDAAVDPKSKLDQMVALFKVAEANLQIARKAREDCTLKAPFDGMVAKRYVDNYQNVTQGKAIISLQDLSSLEVEVDLPEWLVAKAKGLDTDSTAIAEYDSLPGKKISLKMREFTAEADPQTRTYPVRFAMDSNPDTSHVNIMPGMTASVTIRIIPKEKTTTTFLLPVWSVDSSKKKDQPYVFVVDTTAKPWVVRQRNVTVGELTGDSILIRDGLKTGERVVIAGASRLSDGMPVSDLPAFLQNDPQTGSEAQELGIENSVPTGVPTNHADFQRTGK